MMPPWVNECVGVPFRDKGFSLDGWHCWGLVWYLYHHRAKITLPQYGDISAADWERVGKTIAAGCVESEWLPVDGVCKLFDVAVMQGRSRGQRLLFHVGVMITSTILLHVEEKRKTICVPITHSTVKNRLISIHRHRQLV